jgi:hypothetical protein
VRPYIVVIYWRGMSWTLRARAFRPETLKGLLANFGDEPSEMKVMPAN